MKTFINSIKDLFTRTYDFQGVSSRAEFWWAMLFYQIIAIPLSLILEYHISLYKIEWAILYFILYTAIPLTSLTFRRIRAIGKFNRETVLTLFGCVPYLFGVAYWLIWFF